MAKLTLSFRAHGDGMRMEGFLEKKGGLLGSMWQERFFRLDRRCKSLEYFENGTKKGCVDLNGATIQPGADGATFTISGPKLRHTYTLRHKNAVRRSEWLAALNEATHNSDSCASCDNGSRPSPPPQTPDRTLNRATSSPPAFSNTSFDRRAFAELEQLADVSSPVASLPGNLHYPSICVEGAPATTKVDPGWVSIAAEASGTRKRKGSRSVSSPEPPLVPLPGEGTEFHAEDGPSTLSFGRSDTAVAPSPSTCCLPGFDYSGIIRKRGGMLGPFWHERWCKFSIEEKTIRYFTTENGNPKGQLNMEGASIEPWEDGITFTIRGQSAEHTLQCASPTERAVWFGAMQPLVQVSPDLCAFGPPEPVDGSAGSDTEQQTRHSSPQRAPASPPVQCPVCGARFGTTSRAHTCGRCQRLFCNKCCVWRHRLPNLPASDSCRVCTPCHQVLVVVEAEELRRQQLLVLEIDEWDELRHLRRWREETFAYRAASPRRT